MKIYFATAIIAMALAFPATVCALANETFGNAPVVAQPDWPAGVVDVVNLESRVYSFWVNGNEFFYFAGDARALNGAIAKYATIKSNTHRLILLPGTGKTQSLIEKKAIAFDWTLHVTGGIARAVAKKKPDPELTAYIESRKPAPLADPKQAAQWLRDLDDNAFAVRDKASKELAKLGNNAKPILRDSLKMKRSAESRQRIEVLLGQLRQLDVTDLDIPKGIEVVSVNDLLAEAWKGSQDPDSRTSAMAINDLGRLAAYDDKVVPALIENLKKDRNEYVRRMAAVSLAELETPAKAAIPALKQGLNDADANIRQSFEAAIKRIEEAKEPAGLAERVARQRAIATEIDEFKKLRK